MVLSLLFSLLFACQVRAEDDAAETLEALNRQLQSNPTDAVLLVRRSHIWTFLHQYDQAIADLNQASRLAPLPEMDLEKAQIYLAAGWSETGLEHADRYVREVPDDAQGYRVRGRLNASLGHQAKAGADLGAAIEHTKNPTMELYFERAQVLSAGESANLPDAVVTLDQAIARFGPIVTLQSAALEVELRQQRYDAALARLDRVVSTMPRKDSWLARRGDVLVQAGRFTEARIAYQQALDAIDKLPPAHRSQPATKELEKQLKSLVEPSAELAGRFAVPATHLLASKLVEPPAPEVAPPSSTNTPPLPPGGKLRTYHIAAEEIDWDYAPGGNVLQEPFCGDPEAMPGKVPGRIGSRYKKALYQEYTDATFQRRQLRSPNWQHLGLLGPLLRAEVGDRIRVVFTNKTRFPVSIHPHGVFYLKTSEGSGYNDRTRRADKKDDAVHAGEGFTYEWLVPERAGPGPNDPSSLVWLYHSHVQASKDSNAGLVGAIIITAKGKARPDGRPVDVDREFVTLFNIFDENQSWYSDLNLKTYLGSTNAAVWKDPAFRLTNLKHAINGYIFANLPLMSMGQGERVRWYLVGLGSETDLHTPHWHGNSVLFQGHRTDVIELLPASMKVADMAADNPGIWMFHCHVNDHMAEGMSARYQVLGQQPAAASR